MLNSSKEKFPPFFSYVVIDYYVVRSWEWVYIKIMFTDLRTILFLSYGFSGKKIIKKYILDGKFLYGILIGDT